MNRLLAWIPLDGLVVQAILLLLVDDTQTLFLSAFELHRMQSLRRYGTLIMAYRLLPRIATHFPIESLGHAHEYFIPFHLLSRHFESVPIFKNSGATFMIFGAFTGLSYDASTFDVSCFLNFGQILERCHVFKSDSFTRYRFVLLDLVKSVKMLIIVTDYFVSFFYR